jgi:TrmH family RNA methyltransferase
MTTISSPHNEGLKEVRRLSRRRERERSGRFAVEGEDLIAAAQAAGRPPLAGYRVSGSDLGGPAFLDVEPGALAAVSTLGSGTRAIAVYEQRWSAPSGPLCVYLHDVHDPGNVGAVLRSALAFGASCVALGPGCADPHGPKAVRASMGALFGVPLARAAGPEALPGERIALAARAGAPLRGPAGGEVSLVIGGERAGLPEAVLAACDRVAHIPIASESLNAAMAATVALYEMTRGWRSRPQAGEPGPSPFPIRLPTQP